MEGTSKKRNERRGICNLISGTGRWCDTQNLFCTRKPIKHILKPISAVVQNCGSTKSGNTTMTHNFQKVLRNIIDTLRYVGNYNIDRDLR